MDGRVEVRARVLATLKPVPVPGRAALVVARELVQAEARRVVPLRWQRQNRRVGGERRGQVNNAQASGLEFLDQLHQDVRAWRGHAFSLRVHKCRWN